MTDTVAPRMLNDVSAADFAVADSSIDAVLCRYLKQEYEIADPAWLEHRAKEISNRRLGIRRCLRRLILRGRNAREQTEVHGRAIGIVSSNPSKLFMALTPGGWQKFMGLTRENKKGPEYIARLEARTQAQRAEFQSEACNIDRQSKILL